MRPAELVRESAACLVAHGVESPHRTAEALLVHILGTDRAGLYARREDIDTATAGLFEDAIRRRCNGTPLQYLTGEQQFMDLLLTVRPGVFIPRPETEVLAGAALEVLTVERSPVVVDVGTGSGALALAVKRWRPDARVLATDISAEAVDLARWNASRLGLEVELSHGDLLEPLPPALQGTVDLIVSNPPYVTAEEYRSLPEEVRAEPPAALLGGVEFHRRLLRDAPEWLRPGGWLAVEIGAEQGMEVRTLFERSLRDVEILQDLARRDRVVRGVQGVSTPRATRADADPRRRAVRRRRIADGQEGVQGGRKLE
ncbi:MAG: peptide chain release factor N(5)-glutamine methyltransferase [Actinomycetota bacterium]